VFNIIIVRSLIQYFNWRLNTLRINLSVETNNLLVAGWAQMETFEDFKLLNVEIEKLMLKKVNFRDVVTKLPEVKTEENTQ
jgi:hypothetical protein